MSATTQSAPKLRPISADSHVTEPPNCFSDNIEAKFRDRAPRMIRNDQGADVYVLEGMRGTISLGLLAAAGKDPKTIVANAGKFEELHRGGWDAKARIADQDHDGVAGEIVYPSIGMVVCQLADIDLRQACMMAYNRWLQQFVADAPDRVFGIGQTAVRSVKEAIEDVRLIKAMGFKGVMLPGEPGTEFYYDDPKFDPLWDELVALGLPISFHILTSRRSENVTIEGMAARNPMSLGQSVIRGNQDIIQAFIWGHVFVRVPGLKLVCVEADAGWVPHFAYRMNTMYKRHRYWMKVGEMPGLPGDYLLENVYFTFQDDWTVFRMLDMVNPRRLLWANDFPHSDATWPNSQALLDEHTKRLTPEQKSRIVRDNVRALYQL